MGAVHARSLDLRPRRVERFLRIAQNAAMPASDPASRNKDHIGGLAKGLRLVEAFDAAHTRLTITQAAAIVRISQASARRCLLTLCQLGYMQTDGKHFWLGHGALKVGNAYASSTRLPRLLQPALDALSERTRESASVVVLHDKSAVIAARSTARRTLRIGLGVGSRLPLYCSSAGRSLLAALPRPEAGALMCSEPLLALTPRTVTEIGRLHRQLLDCRQRGYSVCDEEIELGVRSIAVPLLNEAGDTIAAMTISMRAERMTLGEMVAEFLPALLRTQAWARSRVD
jgi:IclR family pca regulon transcriptional regulator